MNVIDTRDNEDLVIRASRKNDFKIWFHVTDYTLPEEETSRVLFPIISVVELIYIIHIAPFDIYAE